jgi:hypothetical protein
MMIQILKYNILFFLLGFTFLISFQASGQKVLPVDNSRFKKIEIPKTDIEKYKKDKAFDYEEKQITENFLTRAYIWLTHKIKAFLYKILRAIFGQKNAGKLLRIFIKSLPYLAVLVFVYLIFRFLIGTDLISLSKNKKFKQPQVINLDDEQIIKEADLDQLINEAIGQNDYRLAVRYFYLKLLKMLMDKDLIKWHSDKTNRDYVNEIKNPLLKKVFSELTFIYDYVWYGKYQPSSNDFESIKQQFDRFEIP